ncbi:MAG: hypothetical protein J3Q66DRAFT_358800 [Benniella sp.]|nr:MAG: hypothetical protein J3Q66DRAFT_358800 [Benniella sp.]
MRDPPPSRRRPSRPAMSGTQTNRPLLLGSNPSSPSPYHSSFRPTLTAATVTPAAASGRPAAPAGSTTSTLGTGSVFGAATTTSTTTPGSVPPSTAAATSTSISSTSVRPFVAPASTSTVLGMFGLSNPAPTSTTGGLAFGSFDSSSTSAASTALGGIGSTSAATSTTASGSSGVVSTAGATATGTTGLGSGGTSATTTPSLRSVFTLPPPTSFFSIPASSTATAAPSHTGPAGGGGGGISFASFAAARETGTTITAPSILSPEFVRSISFQFQWNPLMVAKGKSFSQTVRPQDASVKAASNQFECAVKRIENCYLFSLTCSSDEYFERMKWIHTAILVSPDLTMQCRHAVSSWIGSRMISISGREEMRDTDSKTDFSVALLRVKWLTERLCSSRRTFLIAPIETKRFQVGSDGHCRVDITLSNQRLSTPVTSTMTPGTSQNHCDSILSRMLDDESSHDVFFEFDVPINSYTEVAIEDYEPVYYEPVSKIPVGKENSQEHPPKAADHSGDKEHEGGEGVATENSEEQDGDKENTDEGTKGLKDEDAKGLKDEDTKGSKDEGTNGLKDEGANGLKDEDTKDGNDPSPSIQGNSAKGKEVIRDTGIELKNGFKANSYATSSLDIPTRTETVSAHKIVLCHFDYFKTMFSGPFAEGGPGVKRIKIKDTDVCCFRLLIEFLYLGQLRLSSAPVALTEDKAEDHVPTWEDVYLISDRYNIPELRRMALTRILSGLESSWAIPFLFRTAYLFEEMRLPVIKFVVRNSVSSIVDKNLQKTYYDHPECSSIFGEIITELWAAT